ncbi:MAG TPA: hypothetical protein VFB12_28775 [Ktedonobacteraceae bacterium]|nr:hypothetical protein [Ktedonobacteraceae bacterium]
MYWLGTDSVPPTIVAEQAALNEVFRRVRQETQSTTLQPQKPISSVPPANIPDLSLLKSPIAPSLPLGSARIERALSSPEELAQVMRNHRGSRYMFTPRFPSIPPKKQEVINREDIERKKERAKRGIIRKFLPKTHFIYGSDSNCFVYRTISIVSVEISHCANIRGNIMASWYYSCWDVWRVTHIWAHIYAFSPLGPSAIVSNLIGNLKRKFFPK